MIIIFLLILVILLGYAWSQLTFSHYWNHGVCRDCGEKWELFDYDSQGGKGYTCGDHYLWH